MPTLIISTSAPDEVVQLMWDEFFSSRQRGISVSAHFPWKDDGANFYVSMRKNQKLVGGLVVRQVMCRENRRRGGIVGLVCIAPEFRQSGYAGVLLQGARDEAVRRGFSDLILWTRKPGVYSKLGFVQLDSSLFGSVKATTVPCTASMAFESAVWPATPERRGLPPFALAGTKLTSADAALTIIEDTHGPILAEWAGRDDAVVALLKHAMPASWRLNALASDTLLHALEQESWTLELAFANLQMLLPLVDGATPSDAYQLRVLDRI